jgi:hypothetical protein
VLNATTPLTLSNTLRNVVTGLVSTTSVALPSMVITSSGPMVSGRLSGNTKLCGLALSLIGGER